MNRSNWIHSIQSNERDEMKAKTNISRALYILTLIFIMLEIQGRDKMNAGLR